MADEDPGSNPNFENWLLEISGVDCNIYTGPTGEDGHLVEKTSPDQGRSAFVRFKCNWQDRNDLLAGLVGTVDYVGGTIARTPPTTTRPRRATSRRASSQADVLHGGRAIEGRGWKADPDGEVTGTPGWGYFRYAILDAEYTNPPSSSSRPPGPTPVRVQRPGRRDVRGLEDAGLGRSLQPADGGLRLGQGTREGKPVQDTNVGIIIPRYELSVTRMRMPLVPCQLLDSLIGTVNETDAGDRDQHGIARGRPIHGVQPRAAHRSILRRHRPRHRDALAGQRIPRLA